MDSCATLLAAAACCVAHGLYALLRFRKNSLFAANVIIVDMSAACERASFRQRRLCIAGKSRLVSVRQHEGDVAKVVFRTRDTVARLPPPHLLALVEPRRWIGRQNRETAGITKPALPFAYCGAARLVNVTYINLYPEAYGVVYC